MSIPGSANPLLLASAAAAGGYEIERSVRLNSADSAYFSRTPTSSGNRKTWTWAGWVKLGAVGTVRQIFTSRTSGSPYALFYIFSDDKISFADNNLNTHTTAAVYRDPSAWYHIQLAVDTTDATAANRVRLWVNGSLQTWASTTAPTQNTDGQINTATAHSIGSPQPYAANEYFSGYLADIHFIDGQALTPSSFGEFDANNVWQPKAYTGTYGTNGFRLDFADNSAATAAALGKDTSGNGNNWTPNNLSVTAGAGNDSLVDSPSSPAGQTDSGAGGTVVGNYATLNPLNANLASTTLSEGNLKWVKASASNFAIAYGTFGVSSGKWYFEADITARSGFLVLGFNNGSAGPFTDSDSDGGWYELQNGIISKSVNGSHSTVATGKSTANGVVGVAIDCDTGEISFYHTNILQATATGLRTNQTYFPRIYVDGTSNSSTVNFNFGQRPFAYTAPSGFKALCTANLPTPTIEDGSTVMDVKLYTGNGSTQTISGLGFSPDLVWIKGRSGATDHALYDIVRGAQLDLVSNSTAAETTQSTGLTAFNSDGFSLGALAKLNTSSATYAGWCWDAGSSTVTNTQGSITSSVRANASAGFSIVTYTGTGSNATVGHGLGVVPEMIWVKDRNASGGWKVYHASAIISGFPAYRNVGLLNSIGSGSGFRGTGNGYPWGNTAPSSTVFSVSNLSTTSDVSASISSRDYVAFCWAPVSSYSAFGSYTGNGSASDGPFVYLGFRPAVVIVKMTSSTGNWTILDDKREGYNVDNDPLYPNLPDAEGTTDLIDITSNGFKVRTTDATFNTNTGTYIYAAWASSPFAYARAR